MPLTLREVFQALDYGTPTGGAQVTFPHVSTDTRTMQPGDLFVALTGPTTDGHQFIPHALRAGAGGLVVSQQVVASLDTPVLRVPDTEVAYGLLARFWRDRFNIPVIGVTGSVGKTTLKEMLACTLSPLGPVLKTPTSQNNETGVPRALLQLTSEHKAAVVEMGMRGAGQIAYLCGIANPSMGVVTIIADNHLELLGSMDAIADAKGELVQAISASDPVFLNADDPYLPRLKAKASGEVVTFGLSPSRDFYASDVLRTETGWTFTLHMPQDWDDAEPAMSVEINSLSRHDVSNALAAIAVAKYKDVTLAAAAEALKAYVPPPMRMQVIKTAVGVTVLNDAYNAAPASMKSALETLTAYPGGRKIAFLGDMRELGARADEAHRELGGVIAALGGLAALYTVGSLAALIPDAAQRFADGDDAARFARESFAPEPGDIILVKASRAVALEKVVEALAPPAPNSGGVRGEGVPNPANPNPAPPELGAGGAT